ncbi:uncharacterized protein LOC121958018 isoform X2 [Plectropomus leopardus]|uniref:uncharacterized protein LOC121958018 isoform X2 n=1 Tax=Plectropomus leopardus TaxID=160734 RepID=UPI001C4B3C32|nr:uncharacterized protein LOC121958018 isoform X2 [Plectropomus leopardus]
MFTLVIFCHVWFLQTFLIGCSENFTVTKFSVPEKHNVCLQCGGSDRSTLVWTHLDRKVLVTRQGSYETNEDRQHFLLLSNGSLCVLRLEDSDSGKYHCNQQLVAELQVLTGLNFRVSAGWTLLLPCNGSSRPKKRWSHRRKGGRERGGWETVLIRFRNRTVKSERSRFSYGNDALQIQDLQPEDAGEYQCNGELQARLTVLTDEVEKKKKEKKRPENALLLVAVVGLGLMMLLMVIVCVLLTSIKCRRRKKHRHAAQRHEDTELQPWKTSNTQTEREVYYESPSLPEETIHYASLGRQNWRDRACRDRPCRTPPDQDHHDVIYSSVITRPAKKHKRTPLLPDAEL